MHEVFQAQECLHSTVHCPGLTHTRTLGHRKTLCLQSGKGHHVTKSKSRVPGHLLASRGIVAAYPKAVKLGYLTRHAKHYLLHDTVLIR